MQVKIEPTERAETLGQYIIENRATVRSTAKKFGISKSTVHMDVQKVNVLKPRKIAI
ncbi:MAG: sporulation transcriptional regulator SpoIIID [Ruminococcus sp.]|nr:sporulation transcriptional regulator SpoIIID [Ruminococcus sp.]